MAILREPVSRAYSHWWHRYTRRQERLSFGEAVDANLAAVADGPRFTGDDGARAWAAGVSGSSAAHATYVDLGYYAEQLRRYHALFAPSQLLVLLYEDLERDPVGTTRALWKHVGVDPDRDLADAPARNAARATMETRAWKPVARLYASLGLASLVPEGLKRRVSRALQGPAATRPPVDPSLRARLVEHYRERNADLAELLGSDLSAWSAGVP